MVAENLCCSLLSHQQHSYPGWINPSTTFFACSHLMWFQQLQTGGIQTAGSWKGWNSTTTGIPNGCEAAWQCLAEPKMRTPQVLLLFCCAVWHHLEMGLGQPESPAGWWQGAAAITQWALGGQWDLLSVCQRETAGKNNMSWPWWNEW